MPDCCPRIPASIGGDGSGAGGDTRGGLPEDRGQRAAAWGDAQPQPWVPARLRGSPRRCGTQLFIALSYLFIVLERQLLFMTLGPRGRV